MRPLSLGLADSERLPVKRERLFAQIPAPRLSKSGIAADDILRVPAAPELVCNLLDCLHSEVEIDIVFGLMFAENLHQRPDFERLAKPSLPALTAAIRSAVEHASLRVRASAVRSFVTYRAYFDDYSAVMRSFLISSEPLIRREALVAAPTFLASGELAALLPFREDLESSETGGMGGPLRYTTRDLALETAELIVGRPFSAGDCFERREGSEVSWRSWSAFIQWLEGERKGSFFGI